MNSMLKIYPENFGRHFLSFVYLHGRLEEIAKEAGAEQADLASSNYHLSDLALGLQSAKFHAGVVVYDVLVYITESHGVKTGLVVLIDDWQDMQCLVQYIKKRKL